MESLCERARRAEDDRERRVAQARADERTQIAREMHDGLAHRLSLVAATAGPSSSGRTPGRNGSPRPPRWCELTMLLDGANGIRVVGEAGDGAEVPAALDAHPVDLVLMDLRMPRVDGITATARVRSRRDPPEVVVLTTFDADEGVLRALRAGASGFLLKDTPPPELVSAVLRVAAGDPILSPRITRRLMQRAASGSQARDRARAALAGLSDREREVAAAVGRGSSNGEIAAALHVGVAAVKARISHILVKLGLGNRTQIALLVHDADLA